jgi:hypothetical protein
MRRTQAKIGETTGEGRKVRDESHLNAIRLRLSNERARLSEDPTEGGRILRATWIVQLERELRDELALLDMSEANPEISDDELLEELSDEKQETR